MNFYIKNNPILQCVSLLCWLFLFYIPLFNQIQLSQVGDQRIVLCTLLGTQIIQPGGAASTTNHANFDCPCSTHTIGHNYNTDHLVGHAPNPKFEHYYTDFIPPLHYQQQRPRAPPIS